MFADLPPSRPHLREDERRLLARLAKRSDAMRLEHRDLKMGRALKRRGLVTIARWQADLIGPGASYHATITAAGRDAISPP